MSCPIIDRLPRLTTEDLAVMETRLARVTFDYLGIAGNRPPSVVDDARALLAEVRALKAECLIRRENDRLGPALEDARREKDEATRTAYDRCAALADHVAGESERAYTKLAGGAAGDGPQGAWGDDVSASKKRRREVLIIRLTRAQTTAAFLLLDSVLGSCDPSPNARRWEQVRRRLEQVLRVES